MSKRVEVDLDELSNMIVNAQRHFRETSSIEHLIADDRRNIAREVVERLENKS